MSFGATNFVTNSIRPEILHINNPNNSNSKTPINRFVVLDPDKAYSSHNFYAKAWKVAAIVSVIAFVAIAAAASIFVGIHFSSYLIICSIAITVAMGPAFKAFAWLNAKSDMNASIARQMEFIAKRTHELSAKNPGEWNQALQAHGIQPHQINRFSEVKQSDLSQLIAGYEFWKNQTEELDKEHLAVLNIKTDDLDTKKAFQAKAYDIKLDSLVAKTQAAFMYGMITNPFHQGTMDDISYVHKPSLDNRFLELTFDKTDRLILFKDQKYPSLGVAHLSGVSIPQLSQEVWRAAKKQ